MTIRKCFRNDNYLRQRFNACDFGQRFQNCNLTTFKITNLSGGGIHEFILLLKWSQYIIKVYIRTCLCSLGLITNLCTLKVIYKKKPFKNSMYKHICANALFNVAFCFVYLLSLMNICIFPKSSFCSSIWQTEFSQYFHIYGISLRLCCNIYYIFFYVSHFVLSGTSNKNKLRKFIEKRNITFLFNPIHSSI